MDTPAHKESIIVAVPFGTRVLVRGLQSHAGKYLNNSLGIILGGPVHDDARNILRYPVRIYALVDDLGESEDHGDAPRRNEVD